MILDLPAPKNAPSPPAHGQHKQQIKTTTTQQ
jgi:hypothetical protein